MIKFIVIEAGFAILKWEDLNDSLELKKFLESCEVTLHFHNLAPTVKTEEDCDELLKELSTENSELKKQIESKENVIRAYEHYINTLKEDGVLDG